MVAATTDIIAPQRFSPGLRAAIEEALRPPNHANLFTQEEITEIFECGVAQGRYEEACERREQSSALRNYLAFFLFGGVACGVIGLVVGFLVSCWWAG